MTFTSSGEKKTILFALNAHGYFYLDIWRSTRSTSLVR